MDSISGWAHLRRLESGNFVPDRFPDGLAEKTVERNRSETEAKQKKDRRFWFRRPARNFAIQSASRAFPCFRAIKSIKAFCIMNVRRVRVRELKCSLENHFRCPNLAGLQADLFAHLCGTDRLLEFSG